ncbi:hypothetical protein J19TS2_43460 [Cohnella xylanilytica]|uniref:RHS repeat protein n=1 Tax=Cohnella xylanilytica TaxID=557555 RepID=A0A841U752_9BACL|nr:RHS repeat protein [Cohnella xylanilytica]MBB6695482.1 RHS repeat protein [Cohnella xylanilytica]GIO14791.1 hypothetical protein J19TS2_43460 [Cohnella xylanilytica]
MKRRSIVSIFAFLVMVTFGSAASAETLEEQMNNLIGPQQQYNTKLSPVYLRTNTAEESISPQSGDLTLVQTDYVLPGRNGLDLEFKRIYKSGSSNIQEMNAKYVGGAWVDYVESDNDTPTFYENRYNLGIGMRFSFPTMEIKDNKDKTNFKFLHTESGDVYRLRPYTLNDEIVYMPDGQTVQDVVVRESNAFSNGQSDGVSKFMMTGKDGKKTYFADDGAILGIVDRYGNQIVFEHTKLDYKINNKTITKKVISKITDTVGRVTTIEYKEDATFKVGKIDNKVYGAEESYKASQNPNTTDSGDLQGKFQVIVHLPTGKTLVYDKTAALVNKTKNVLRTRLQRVFDVDGQPKYHLWYEQPDLGFTFMNKDKYKTFNRYENLTQIDYVGTNRLTRYIYNSYKKGLSEKGSMEYRKVFEKRELVKKGYDSSIEKFEERFKTDVKNKITYAYTNEADGYGFEGYKQDDYDYLKVTYRYYTEITDGRGSKTKLTYDGLNELVVTERNGSGHKEVIRNEMDGMKLIKKSETLQYDVHNGQTKEPPVRRVENFRYDQYGNLTNYTGPEAARNENGEPTDNEHTVVYTYAYDRFHALTSKTWKQDRNSTVQILYDIDEKGNVVKETKINANNKDQGVITDYTYDSYGNLTGKAAHSNGQTFATYYEYSTDADGRDMKGAYLTREYSLQNAQQISKRYAYDFLTGNRTAEVDAKGNRTNHRYDVLNRLVETTNPDGSKQSFDYKEQNFANMNIRFTDPENNVHVYEYDISGSMVQESVNNGDVGALVLAKIEYDQNGNKTQEKDANGNIVRYEYDSSNRLIKKTMYDKDGALKGTTTVDYVIGASGDTPLLVTITDEEGYPRKYSYDSLNRLIRLDTTPDRNTIYRTSYEYDYVGNLIAETDARNFTSHYSYDYLGRLRSKQDAMGNETSYLYNALNQISEQREPGGKITGIIYDELGRVKEKRTFAEGSESFVFEAYEYDPAGNVIRRQKGEDFGGKKQVSTDISYSYNSVNRLTDEYPKIDASRTGHISYEYDKNGNKTSTKNDADSSNKQYRLTTSKYDFAGRVIEETGSSVEISSNGTRIEHGSYQNVYERDGSGNVVKMKRFNGTGYDTISYDYDYRNQVKEKREPYQGQPEGKKTQFVYDKTGRLTTESLTVQGKNIATSYQLDGLGRTIRKTDPLGNVTRYVYDSSGNLVKEIDPRYSSLEAVTAPGMEYEYDGLNRVVKTSAFDGNARTVISYKQYDGRGNVTLDVQGEGYNVNDPTDSFGIRTEYDLLDRKVKVTSAQMAADNKRDGTQKVTLRYSYDGSGNLTSVIDAHGEVTNYSYYLNNLLKEKRYPDGSKESYDYDLSGKSWNTIINRNGGTTKSYMSIFDKPYRIEYPDGSSELFTYSPRGDLAKKIDQVGNESSFEYDESDNLTAKIEFVSRLKDRSIYKRTELHYDESNNLMDSETFSYERTSGTGVTPVKASMGDRTEYESDKAGRLVRVSGPNGHETIQEYDRAGNIVVKKQKVEDNNYDITRYEYDVRSQLVSETLLVRMSDLAQGELVGAKFDGTYIDRVLSSTKYEYDKNGQLKSRTDAKGNKTVFSYDLDNRLVQKKDPLNNVTSYEYNDNGQLTKETDGLGSSIFYEYDSMNQMVRKKQMTADGSYGITRYFYDNSGNLIKEISPNQYDASLDHAASSAKMKGISYLYDVMNRRIATISPEGAAVEYVSFDALGRVVKVVDGLRYTGSLSGSAGTVMEYDGLGNMVKRTDSLGNSESYEYNVLGKMTKSTDPRGFVTRYEYFPDGSVSQVTYADNGVVKYAYDKLGRVISEINPLGAETTYTYSSFGTEKSVTDAYGKSTDSKFDLIGNLLSTKDKRGNMSLYRYDGNRQLVEKRIPLELDGSGNIVYSVETYLYDAAGQLMKQSLTGSQDKKFLRETSYTYYPNGLLHTRSDNSGGKEEYYYDKNGNLSRTEKLRTSALRDIERYAYDSSDRMIQYIQLADKEMMDPASLGGTIKEDGDHPGMVRLVTAYEYDLLGNRTKETDPRGFEVRYAYDEMNRLIQMSRQLNGSETNVRYAYDKSGNRVSMTNELGYTTQFEFDGMNHLVSKTDAEGKVTSSEYDLAGNMVAEVDSLGNRITYAYDKLNRLIMKTDANKVVVGRYVYDEDGHQVKSIDAKGYASGSTDYQRYGEVYSYDLAGRLTSATDREGHKTTYRYNVAGEKVSETNALNKTYTYEYDKAGRLTRVTDPIGTSVVYSYDLAGNKLDMTDGRGKLTAYRYGSFGTLIETTNPDRKSTSYRYDPSFQLVEMTDRNGNHTRYSYDGRGLLLEQKVTETNDSVKFTYDKAGNRLTMSDASGTSEYSYDRNNRVKSIVKNNAIQVSYSYDSVGNIKSVTDGKGYATTFAYDASNRMAAVTAGGKTTSYTYDLNGNRTSVSYEGGVQENYTFDRNNRLLVLKNVKPDGTLLSSYTYTYDAAGKQSSKTDSYGKTSYVYDDNGRIVKVEAPGKTTVYSYDKSGNRQTLNETYTSAQPSGFKDPSNGKEVAFIVKKSEYVYSGANLLQRLVERMLDESGQELLEKTTDYLYDDNGNELRQQISYIRPHTRDMKQVTGANPNGDGVTNNLYEAFEKTTNAFDGFNRLIRAERIQGGLRSSIEYTYDGDGLRTRKVSRSSKNDQATVTNYTYDRQYVILETDANNNVSVRYVRGVNYIARIDASSKLSYFLFNGHGDVVHTVSESGTVENQYDYDIFGNPILTVEQYSSSIRYSGEFYDAEVGLYYLRARYYDPYIGRFISEDTYTGQADDPLSLNLYTYVHNDPIMFWDPTGHWVESDKNLNIEDQAKIIALTTAYYNATSSQEKKAIQAQASSIRDSAKTAQSNGTYNLNVVTPLIFKTTEITQVVSIATNTRGYMKAEEWSSAIKSAGIVSSTPERKVDVGNGSTSTVSVTTIGRTNLSVTSKNVVTKNERTHEVTSVATSNLDISYNVTSNEVKFLTSMASNGTYTLEESLVSLELLEQNGGKLSNKDLEEYGLKTSSHLWGIDSTASYIQMFYEFSQKGQTAEGMNKLYLQRQQQQFEQLIDGMIPISGGKFSLGSKQVTKPGYVKSKSSPSSKGEPKVNRPTADKGTGKLDKPVAGDNIGNRLRGEGTGKIDLTKSTNPEDFLNTALNRQGLDKAPSSMKEKWSESGFDYEVRIHPADPRYDKEGSIYRVSRRQQGTKEGTNQGYGWEYLGDDGKWYHTSELKSGNDAGAKATHIQLK